MDRLRRSFRASIKRKKDLTTQSLDPTLRSVDGVVKCVAESTKLWQADEVAVRSGLCSFQVKVRLRTPLIPSHSMANGTNPMNSCQLVITNTCVFIVKTR